MSRIQVLCILYGNNWSFWRYCVYLYGLVWYQERVKLQEVFGSVVNLIRNQSSADFVSKRSLCVEYALELTQSSQQEVRNDHRQWKIMYFTQTYNDILWYWSQKAPKSDMVMSLKGIKDEILLAEIIILTKDHNFSPSFFIMCFREMASKLADFR